MKKFWNWIRDADEGRVLRLEGPIDSESFWGDEITPQMFRDDLEAEEGDITVWINSPGGNVFAAAEIYTMIRDYKGAVTVKIASIAASAASVVAMAGDRVEMSPTALLMIHDPSTIAMGNAKDMEKAITTLNEVKESIVNAYVAKSGLSRKKVSDLMSNETWMNAKKAVELGFADEILYAKTEDPDPEEETDEDDPEEEKGDGVTLTAQMYSGRIMDLKILNRLGVSAEEPVKEKPPEDKPPEEKPPQIGMDGKMPDGSLPYMFLVKQLEFLK